MLNNIQVLRGVAALLVVFYHLQASLGDYAGLRLSTHFGASGVDIFFVISGFIMFYATRRFERPAAEFWRDRVIRIVPLYWLATALIVLLFLTGLKPNGVQKIDAGDVLTSLFFVPDVRADGEKGPVLLLGWTLIHEMFFYLCFGALLFLKSQLRSLLVLTALFAGFIALRPAFADSYALTVLANPIIVEFLFGAALALWYAQAQAAGPVGVPRSAGWAMLVVGMLGIGCVELLGLASGQGLGQWRCVLYGLPALAIVAGALVLERHGLQSTSRLWQVMGAASYALYLFHAVVNQSVAIALRGLGTKLAPIWWQSAVSSGVAALIMGVLCLTAAVVFATLVHFWVELPLTRWLKLRFARQVAVPALGQRSSA